MISFASDNNSGVHPKILEAFESANKGHCPAYGNDAFTAEVIELFKHAFGDNSSVYFVFLGTAANVLGLKTLMQTYDAVICTDVAHIHQDEGGAPELLAGKLLTVPHEGGRLNIEKIFPFLNYLGNPHKVQPKVVSITQATEYGTVYSIEELKRICKVAHDHGLYVHMDGARLTNAAVALGVSLKEMTADVGVDVLSFGGTKNGMMFGEAVVFFDAKLASQFPFIQKQGMQMASKMRFIAAQFKALLTDNLWVNNAKHANDMASYFATELLKFEDIVLTHPVETNSIFVKMPPKIIPLLQQKFPFYVWNKGIHEIRLMTSFDTQKEHIDAFIELLDSII